MTIIGWGGSGNVDSKGETRLEEIKEKLIIYLYCCTTITIYLSPPLTGHRSRCKRYYGILAKMLKWNLICGEVFKVLIGGNNLMNINQKKKKKERSINLPFFYWKLKSYLHVYLYKKPHIIPHTFFSTTARRTDAQSELIFWAGDSSE